MAVQSAQVVNSSSGLTKIQVFKVEGHRLRRLRARAEAKVVLVVLEVPQASALNVAEQATGPVIVQKVVEVLTVLVPAAAARRGEAVVADVIAVVTVRTSVASSHTDRKSAVSPRRNKLGSQAPLECPAGRRNA
mmetsp:Transcript_50622/g.134799  ORF Transcript_50622/g.134799 Transcript_50622/m.134799 type:complete len:134 (-) Transcript_50622:140-541(-)